MNRFSLLAAALALALGGPSFAARATGEPTPATAERPSGPSLVGPSAHGSAGARPVPGYRDAVARALPSVVTVRSTPAAQMLQSSGPKAPVSGFGSGVVIGRDSDVVTNYHVVQDATEVAVSLMDGTVLPSRVVGVDPLSDIALLRVDSPGLQPIAMADIEDVQPGDIVLAIGNPMGVGQSVSQGIVSAVVRKGARPIENFIQTDAAINPGHSGGALLDTAGRLVGINAMILSQGGGSEGIGFAIPVDLVQTVAASLKSRGRVPRGWLGWAAESAPKDQGALVLAVERNGPAHRAGILPGDILRSIGGRPVQRLLDAANVVLGSDPGTRVAVEVVRGGAPAIFDIELGPLPAASQPPF